MRKIFQNVVNVLCICVMVFYPVVASAQSITVDGSAPANQRPNISASGGKPLINIAPPTNGVSVNRYSTFSTDSGAIFNNSKSPGASRTGGTVAANTRIGSGAEARVILNDVRGTQRSNLSGDFEVFGKKADVVITNQNGITCNGCSFINTSRATLGTGSATVNANGDVILNVKKGNVHIGRAGTKSDGNLQLVGRTVTVDGPVKATVVDAIGGASTYNARSRAVGANTGTGAAGGLYAVDATQFGAMTAGQIRIIGNENGLGVRTQGNLKSTSTDVSLHSKGSINHASVDSKRDFVVRGATGFVQQDRGVVKAGRNVDIRALSFAQAGTARIEAAANVKINAGDAILIAGEVSSATAAYDAGSKVINVGEIIASGDIEIVAGEIWNMRSDRRIDTFFAEGGVADGCLYYCFDLGSLQIHASANWSDRAYMVGHGGVVAAKNLSITSKTYDINNSGVLVAAQSLLLDAKRSVNQQALKAVYRSVNTGGYLKTDITKAKSAAIAGKIAAMTGGTVRDIYNGVRDPLISGSRVFYGAKAHGVGSLTVKAGHHVQNLGGEFKSRGRVLLEATSYDVNLRSHGRWSHNFSFDNNVEIVAGRNINLTNAHFIANAGTLKIHALDGIAADQATINAATYRNLSIRELGDSFNNTFTINTPGWVSITSRGTLTGSRSITASSLYLKSTHGEVNQTYATRTTGNTTFVSHGNMRVANSESSGENVVLKSTAGNIYIQGNARGKALDIDAEHSVINGTSTLYAGAGGINIWAGSSITNEGGRIWSHGNIDLLAGRKRAGNIISSHSTAAVMSGYIRAYGSVKNVRLDTDRGTIRLTNNGVIASGNVALDASGELWIQRSHVEGNTVALEARSKYIVNELGSLVKANLFDVNTRGGQHLYNRTGASIWAKRDVKVTANAMYNHGQSVTAGRDIRLTLANRLENYNAGAGRAVLDAGRHLVIASAKGDVYNRASDMLAGGNISIDAGVDRVQFWDTAKVATSGSLDISSGESGSNLDGIHITGVPLIAKTITMNTTGRVVLYPGSDITTTAGDLKISAGRRFYQLDSDLTSAAQMFVTSNGASITGSNSQSVNYMKYDSAGSVEIYDGYGRHPILKSTTGSVDVISSASHVDTRRATIDARRFVYLSARNNLALQTNTNVRARALDATLKAGVGGHIYYRSGANVSAGRDVRMDSRNHIYVHGRTLTAGRDIISNARAQVEVYNDGASRARLQAGRNITVNSTVGRILTRTSDWDAKTGSVSINAGTHSVEFWGGSSVTTAGAFSARSGNWDGRGIRLMGMPVTATSIHLGSGTGHILLEPGADLTATSGGIKIESAGRYYQRDADVNAPGDIIITSNGAEIDGARLNSANGVISLTSGSNVRLYDAYGRNPVIWAKGAITLASTNSHFENRGNINGGGSVSVTSRNNLHNEYDALIASRGGAVTVQSTHGGIYNRYNGTLDGKTSVTARASAYIYNHGAKMRARNADLSLVAGAGIENHKWSTVRGRFEAGRNVSAQAGTAHFWLHNSDMVAGGNMRVGSTNTHVQVEAGATFTQGGTFTAFSGNYAGYGVRLFGTPITAKAISLSSTSGYIQVEPAALKATAGDITIDAAGRFYQRNSDLTASGAISISANGYENDGSWTTANGGAINVASGGSVDITDAYGRNTRLWATGGISIASANSHFVNNGIINGGGSVSIKSRTNLHNDHAALIRSRAGSITVRSTHGSIYNRFNSALHAKKSVGVRSEAGHIFNHGSTMHAIDTDLTLTASHAVENHKWSTVRGRLEAGRNVSAQAGVSHLWSVASDWIAGGNMQVGSTDRQVEVATGSTFTQGGSFTAFSSNYLTHGVRLYGTPITAKSISLSSSSGYIVLEPAALTATAGDITIDAAGRFYQRNSDLTASGAISISANGYENDGSWTTANGGSINVASGGSVDITDAYGRNTRLWATGGISIASANSHFVNNGIINGGGSVSIKSRTNLHNDHAALIRSRSGSVDVQSTHGNIYNRYSSKVESKGWTSFEAINIYNDGASVTAGGQISMTASNHLRVIEHGAVRSMLVSGTDANLSTSGLFGSFRKALRLNAGTSSVWVRRSDLTAGTFLGVTSENANIHNEYAVLNAGQSAHLSSKGEFRATGGSLTGNNVTIDSAHHLYLLTGHHLTARNGAHNSVSLDAFYDYLVRDSFVNAGQNITLSDARNVYIYDSDIHAKSGKVDYVARGEIRHRIEDTDDSNTTAGTDVRMVAGGLLENYRANIVAGSDIHLESTASFLSNNAADIRAGRDVQLVAKGYLQLHDTTTARDGTLVAGRNMSITAGDTLYADAGFISAGHWAKFKSRLTPRFYAQVYDNLDALHFGVNVSQGSFTSDFNIDSRGAIDIYARDGVTLKRQMRGDNWVRVKAGNAGKITAGYLLRSDTKWLEVKAGGDITLGNTQAAGNVTIESSAGSVINTYNLSSSQNLIVKAKKDIIARHSVATRRGAFLGTAAVNLNAGRNIAVTNALVSSKGQIDLYAAQKEFGTLSVTTTLANLKAGVENRTTDGKAITLVANYGGNISLVGAEIYGRGLVNTFAGAGGGGQYTTSAATFGGTTIKTVLRGQDVRQHAAVLALADTELVGLSTVSQIAQDAGGITMDRGRIQTHNLRIEALNSNATKALYRGLTAVTVGNRMVIDVAGEANLRANSITASVFDFTDTPSVTLNGTLKNYTNNNLNISAKNNLTVQGHSHRRNINLTSLNGVLANAGHLKANLDIRLTANRATPGLNLRNDGLLEAARDVFLVADRGIDPGRIQARNISVVSELGIINGTGAMMASQDISLTALDITTRSVLAQNATIEASTGNFTITGWQATDGGSFATGADAFAGRVGAVAEALTYVASGATEGQSYADLATELHGSGQSMFYVNSNLMIDVPGEVNINQTGVYSGQGDVTLTAGDTVNFDGSRVEAFGRLNVTSFAGLTAQSTDLSGSQVLITAGDLLVGNGLRFNSIGETSIFAVGGVSLDSRLHTYLNQTHFNNVIGTLAGESWHNQRAGASGGGSREIVSNELSRIATGSDLSINTLGDLLLGGVQAEVTGDVTLATGGSLALTAPRSVIEFHTGDDRNGTDLWDVRSHATSIVAGGNFSALAGDSATIEGASVSVDGSLDLAALNSVTFVAAQNIYGYNRRTYDKNFWRTKTTNHTIEGLFHYGTSLTSGGTLAIESQTGDLVTAGSRFESLGGDINLSATEGDILAGVFTDINRESYTKSRSTLFGLISSTSSSLLERINSTGTAALAELDLTIVSAGDTELVGAQLSAGGDLNLDVGGDLRILAAISHEREEFFESRMGAILATTTTERSLRETAVLTSLNANGEISISVGGDTYLTLYSQDGEETQSVAELYPEELAALANLILLDEELLDEYFYEETRALSPAFTAVLSIALTAGYGSLLTGPLSSTALSAGLIEGTAGAYTLTNAGNAVAAFASSSTVGLANGAVSGDIDLGAILQNAALAAGTQFLTASINLRASGDIDGADSLIDAADAAATAADAFGNQTYYLLGGSWNSALTNGLFGGDQLTVAAVLEGAFDATLSSGINSVVTGSDFREGLTTSLVRSVVSLGLADVQNEIGNVFANGANGGEGSLGHILLHGIAGCAAAEASGADCIAGAAGGVTQAIYAGTLEDLTDQERAAAAQTASLLGAFAGYIFSGGDPENISNASLIAQSGIVNNYLNHDERSQVEELVAERNQLCSGFGAGPGPSCSQAVPRVAEIDAALVALKDLSTFRTQELIATCSAGPSLACQAMLTEAEAFNAWTRESWNYDYRDSFSTGGDLLLTGGDFSSWFDLDDAVVEIYGALQDAGTAANQAAIDQAALDLVAEIARFDGRIKVVAGVIEVAGVTVCAVGSGGACALAVLGAVVGANTAYEGTLEIVTGENQLSPAEAALIALSVDGATAEQIVNWVETGVAVVTIVGGTRIITNAADGTLIGRIATNRIVPDEFLDQADLDRFANLRNDLGITSNNQLRRNVAVGEGYVDGADIGEIIGVSGRRGPGVDMPENPIFTTTTVGHPRDLDSEVFVLENLAQRLTPQSTGTIRLLSERTVCVSCQGVITQFREMFPNINLIVRSGTQ